MKAPLPTSVSRPAGRPIPNGFHASWADVDMAAWRWPNFTPKELSCRCGARFCRGEYFHDPDFLDHLQALRAVMARPLVITSGRRCRRHNAAEGGATRSEHMIHIAADISLAGHDRAVLARTALVVGFTGIGFAGTFLHLDQRDGQRVGWNYTPGASAAWTKAFGFDPVARLRREWAL